MNRILNLEKPISEIPTTDDQREPLWEGIRQENQFLTIK